MMPTNRSLLKVILLSLITFGIYGIYFWYKYSVDMNIVCNGDGRHTRGVLARILFSLITFGIYDLVWMYGVGERINYNCQKKRIINNTNGAQILLWYILGSFILIGPFVAMHKLIQGLNDISNVFNTFGNGPVVNINVNLNR